MPTVETFIEKCLSQSGGRYVYGAEVNLDDPDPKANGHALDCSELVQWAAHQAGGFMPDGSGAQYERCLDIPVMEAIAGRGALLFMGYRGGTHVAVSLGNGYTIEARGRDYGTGSWEATGRPWSCAGIMPGFDYGQGGGFDLAQDERLSDQDIKDLRAAARIIKYALPSTQNEDAVKFAGRGSTLWNLMERVVKKLGA